MKNIYFGGAIRGGREGMETYRGLISHLKNYGNVLTEHIGNINLTSSGESLSDSKIHDRDIGWLGKANVLVMDVTYASLGVGYEIGRIVERNLWVPEFQKKNILCLYRPQIDKRLSAMINGCRGLSVGQYIGLDEAKMVIDNFFDSIERLRGNCIK
jgi:hypothetical protein